MSTDKKCLDGNTHIFVLLSLPRNAYDISIDMIFQCRVKKKNVRQAEANEVDAGGYVEYAANAPRQLASLCMAF